MTTAAEQLAAAYVDQALADTQLAEQTDLAAAYLAGWTARGAFGAPPRPWHEEPAATLYHGEALDVLRHLPPDTFDAVITDPPYSSGGFTRGDRNQSTAAKYEQHGVANNRRDFDGDNRDAAAWMAWTACWLTQCHRVTKSAGYCLVFTDWRQLPQATAALQAGGYVWRGILTWDKTEAARPPHTGYFRHQAEFIVWGTKGPSRPSPWGPWPGVYRVKVDQADKHHLTGKPTALLRRLLACVPPGGRLLDPFAGSGTALVAAKIEGRQAVGVELDLHNCKTTRRRLAQKVLPLAAGDNAAAAPHDPETSTDDAAIAAAEPTAPTTADHGAESPADTE